MQGTRQILFSTFFRALLFAYFAGYFAPMEIDQEGLPGLPVSITVSPDELDMLSGLPLRAQQIGALLACGFSPTDIDQAFNLSPGTCSVYKTKYYTSKSLVISPKTRDLIIAGYLRSKSFQLVSGITPAKIDKAGVGELAKSAGLLMARAESLEGTSNQADIGAQISDALSKLSQSVKPKQVTS